MASIVSNGAYSDTGDESIEESYIKDDFTSPTVKHSMSDEITVHTALTEGLSSVEHSPALLLDSSTVSRPHKSHSRRRSRSGSVSGLSNENLEASQEISIQSSPAPNTPTRDGTRSPSVSRRQLLRHGSGSGRFLVGSPPTYRHEPSIRDLMLNSSRDEGADPETSSNDNPSTAPTNGRKTGIISKSVRKKSDPKLRPKGLKQKHSNGNSNSSDSLPTPSRSKSRGRRRSMLGGHSGELGDGSKRAGMTRSVSRSNSREPNKEAVHGGRAPRRNSALGSNAGGGTSPGPHRSSRWRPRPKSQERDLLSPRARSLTRRQLDLAAKSPDSAGPSPLGKSRSNPAMMIPLGLRGRRSSVKNLANAEFPLVSPRSSSLPRRKSLARSIRHHDEIDGTMIPSAVNLEDASVMTGTDSRSPGSISHSRRKSMPRISQLHDDEPEGLSPPPAPSRDDDSAMQRATSRSPRPGAKKTGSRSSKRHDDGDRNHHHEDHTSTNRAESRSPKLSSSRRKSIPRSARLQEELGGMMSPSISSKGDGSVVSPAVESPNQRMTTGSHARRLSMPQNSRYPDDTEVKGDMPPAMPRQGNSFVREAPQRNSSSSRLAVKQHNGTDGKSRRPEGDGFVRQPPPRNMSNKRMSMRQLQNSEGRQGVDANSTNENDSPPSMHRKDAGFARQPPQRNMSNKRMSLRKLETSEGGSGLEAPSTNEGDGTPPPFVRQPPQRKMSHRRISVRQLDVSDGAAPSGRPGLDPNNQNFQMTRAASFRLISGVEGL